MAICVFELHSLDPVLLAVVFVIKSGKQAYHCCHETQKCEGRERKRREKMLFHIVRDVSTKGFENHCKDLEWESAIH